MATIALNRLANKVVEIIRDGNPEYFTGVANVFIKNRATRDGVPYIDVVFKTVVGDNKTIQLMYPDITTINGVAKPGTAVDTAKLLATDVFSQGGGDGSGVTQAQVDAAIAAYDTSTLATKYKGKDKFLDIVVNLDFPSVPAQSVSSALIISDSTTAGISATDRILYCFSTNMNKALYIYGIPGTNLISFYAVNPTAAAIDNLNGTYRVTIYKTG